MKASPGCPKPATSQQDPRGRALHRHCYYLSLCCVPTSETSKHPLVEVGYILQMGKLRLKE